jgi:hypothetical protein
MELAANERREMQIDMILCLAVQPHCVWWDEGVGRQASGSDLLGAHNVTLSGNIASAHWIPVLILSGASRPLLACWAPLRRMDGGLWLYGAMGLY